MSKKSTIVEACSGWVITFQPNAHMYSHTLSATKANKTITIQCEDLALSEKIVGAWIFDLDISENVKRELKQALLQLGNKMDTEFRVYTSSNVYVAANLPSTYQITAGDI